MLSVVCGRCSVQYSVQYSMYCSVQCAVQCAVTSSSVGPLPDLQGESDTSDSKHWVLPHWTLHCTAYCTLHTAHCILHTAHCILHTIHFILYTEHCILHTTHWILAHYTLEAAHYTPHCRNQAKSVTINIRPRKPVQRPYQCGRLGAGGDLSILQIRQISNRQIFG